jgi:hypothetical protein
MPLTFLQRRPRQILLVEINPYQILAALLVLSDSDRAVVAATAEFDRDDFAALKAWIDSENRANGRLAVVCSLVPLLGIVQRERIQPSQLAQPDYLEGLVLKEQKGRFLTATPFKVAESDGWIFRSVNPVDGSALSTAGSARPALICALAHREVADIQQRLLDLGLDPGRIVHGLLSLFGAVYASIEKSGGVRAVAIVVVFESVTAVYILGKEGVHTPNPVLVGLHSIIEAGRKEFATRNDKEVLEHLHSRSPLAVAQAVKLVRRIGRDLKPVIDSYELSTGQPVSEVLCAYLPSSLIWLAEPLSESTGRQPFAVDCNTSIPTLNLQPSPGTAPLGPHWLGALNAAADLPGLFGRNSQQRARGTAAYQRSWHVDCDVALEANHRLVGLRLIFAVAAAAAVVVLGVAVTSWQVYALHATQTETDAWGKRLEENQSLFKQLSASQQELKKQTGVFNRAYELMAEPFQLTDLLINLGRTTPPRMRIDRIESNGARVAISGGLLEPAEEASGTLGRYMDELRRDPRIGPLFSSIVITTLQRKPKGDEVVFELTLRIKRPL